jgi:hypothetical protein
VDDFIRFTAAATATCETRRTTRSSPAVEGGDITADYSEPGCRTEQRRTGKISNALSPPGSAFGKESHLRGRGNRTGKEKNVMSAQVYFVTVLEP